MKRFRYSLVTENGKFTCEGHLSAETRADALIEVGRVARFKRMKVVAVDERPPLQPKEAE